MVIICPKCKIRLKIADEKIGSDGTRFKCPKCSTVLLVKKPLPQARPLDENTVLVAHEDPLIARRIKSILTASGYAVSVAADGIEALVNAAKELPFLILLSVSLPKIYGFEVSERLRKRPETKGMKIILVASLYDKNRYRREPDSLHGADAYIEEYQIEESLLQKVNALKKAFPQEAPERKGDAGEGREDTGSRFSGETIAESKGTDERPSQPVTEKIKVGQPDELIEKARRLARTIVSDIYLYSRARVEDSVKNDSFHSAFASELREGLKLYETRISAEVRKMGDFFNEAVTAFIEKKKRDIS
ncbi:MAG TPA: response regulator [Thermodesulfovibrionales bacterium]|nr:response regulator [Thermodesulfovibrionales bacterium]